jgi:hypothetical protein
MFVRALMDLLIDACVCLYDGLFVCASMDARRRAAGGRDANGCRRKYPVLVVPRKKLA